jgi:hypothetical protein
MQELENARLLLVSALPEPAGWTGPAAMAFQTSLWGLIYELEAARENLWV